MRDLEKTKQNQEQSFQQLLILKSSFLVFAAVLQMKFDIWLEFFLA